MTLRDCQFYATDPLYPLFQVTEKKKEKDSEAIKNFGLFLVPKLEAIRSQASVKHPLEAFHLASLFRLWSYSSFDECPPTISKAAVHVLTTRQRWQRMVRFQLKRKKRNQSRRPSFQMTNTTIIWANKEKLLRDKWRISLKRTKKKNTSLYIFIYIFIFLCPWPHLLLVVTWSLEGCH